MDEPTAGRPGDPRADASQQAASRPSDTVVGALTADPIIQAMADEVDERTVDLRSFDFIGGAYREYRRRGGRLETYLGGPAEAIRRLKHQR